MESLVRPSVGVRTDARLRSCFIYLRPVASSAQVEFHSWNLNKDGQGFSPGRSLSVARREAEEMREARRKERDRGLAANSRARASRRVGFNFFFSLFLE